MPDMTPTERRRVTDIVDSRISSRLDAAERRQKAAMDEGFASVCELIRSAYPSGDPIEHRKAHEQMIEAHKERTDFYRELRKQLASKGLLAILGFVALAIWYFVIDSVRRGGA